MEQVGIVGSPSKTAQVTIDILDAVTHSELLGDLVYTAHPLGNGRHMLAIGTVGEIETRNRWHEDPNMRGVLRLQGSLPHLSADGDIRTAEVAIQAVYETDSDAPPFATFPVEKGGALGMSPTTGRPVYRVDQGLVDGVVAQHKADVICLGHVLRTAVRMPMYLPDFADPRAAGAYHTGVFGKNGSGKTSMACYMLAMQMRHPDLSVLVFDPQGQFTSESKLPFSLKSVARHYGRDVITVDLMNEVRMRKNAPLFTELLAKTRFCKELAIKKAENADQLMEEISHCLHGALSDWTTKSAAKVLRSLLEVIVADEAAMTRIYASKPARERLENAVQRILEDAGAFDRLLAHFKQVHDLFSEEGANASRQNLEGLLHRVLERSKKPKPYVVLGVHRASGEGLNNSDVRARLIREVTSVLTRRAEDQWRSTSGRLVNCLVVFDEAAHYAAAHPESDEVKALVGRLTEAVRETRKVGLGWMFITQEANALANAIYAQLRVKAFGYGLTTSSDLAKIKDEIGSGSALELYRSFADPKVTRNKIWPFMLTGPVSPLSFTGAPCFISVFNNAEEFRAANPEHLQTWTWSDEEDDFDII